MASKGEMMQKIKPRGPGVPLRVGEIVEVRSESEILCTLDEEGTLEGLPFMPEMLQFCGRQFRVAKLAVKLCDTIGATGMHRIFGTVHLEDVRCDGEAHGGCCAGCLLYWKEVWLRRVDEVPPALASGQQPTCNRRRLLEMTRRSGNGSGDEQLFTCQATELMRAAPTCVSWWDLRQYVRDVRCGNAKTLSMARSLAFMFFNKFQGFSRRYLPSQLHVCGARRFPRIDGPLTKTPTGSLDLQPGDVVEIKTSAEIRATLDAEGRNRGMAFDAEMLKYCGRRAEVRARVERIIDEKTGRMVHLGNPCVILEGVTCEADYNQYCPRGIFPFWREIWLKKVD